MEEEAQEEGINDKAPAMTWAFCCGICGLFIQLDFHTKIIDNNPRIILDWQPSKQQKH
ncbi:MAG: hypothetical protein WC455_14200 [Dehalococcoidia bacterium]|jgi:hypothetical protein